MVLFTENLEYRYSTDRIVLRNLNLGVPDGSIYGFVGANGAGKTTALRLMLGLLPIQSGTISLLGTNLGQDRTGVLRQTGSLIEGPSIYDHLTATEHLEMVRHVYAAPAERTETVLRLVDLLQARDKLAGKFSLGMKQRLAIAMAIVHRPKLLVLDEPTNGLDPNGIVDMREFLQRLNREHGTTILVSSHLLSEVEMLATHIGILHRGALLFQGSLDELRAQHRQSSIWIDTSDNAAARQLMEMPLPLKSSARAMDTRIDLGCLRKDEVAQINRKLIGAGIDVYEISTQTTTLENIFMEMVNG
jgi:lantibiotic transport system ATP-binding protein